VAATRTGDLEALMAVLSPGVTLIADGGGKVRAPLLPVVGADKVARFLLTVAGRELSAVDIALVGLNGGRAILVTRAGVAEAVIQADVVDGRIATVYLVGNPDKLAGMSRAGGGAASSG
jgi:RNA polymerase sigma-70 factor (ECF subfamily)